MKAIRKAFAKERTPRTIPKIRREENAKGESPPEERVSRLQILHSLDEEAPQGGGDPEDECMKNHCAKATLSERSRASVSGSPRGEAPRLKEARPGARSKGCTLRFQGIAA